MSKDSLQISKNEARRFLLQHHQLAPARAKSGKKGVLQYIRHVNCIQYDPINVVGQNPHLVLQSRIDNYRPEFLDELLYQDRSLWDGFDKVMSIYPIEDWANFGDLRKFYLEKNGQLDLEMPIQELRQVLLKRIKTKGPISALETEISEKVDWAWGRAKAGRAGLEMLFFEGTIGVSHRVGTRRYFDLAENLVPMKFRIEKSTFRGEKRKEWQIHRRVGGLGIAHLGAGEKWGGMLGMKSPERRAILEELAKLGKLCRIEITGVNQSGFFIRADDLPQLTKMKWQQSSTAAIIAPLDNLMWDRKMIQWLFDFSYVWEVYKPTKQRKYGYYVLPILFGDQFAGRFEPGYDRERGIFTIKNWWWEADFDFNRIEVRQALIDCFEDFSGYLGANSFNLGKSARSKKGVAQTLAPLL